MWFMYITTLGRLKASFRLMLSGCLAVKVFSLDYYLSPPIDELDMCYSKFSGAYSSRMPVIRVYGTTTTGQKICVNVHGVLPYFFVELPAVESDVENFIRDFVFSLEKSIRSKLSTPYMREMYIFDASVVSGVSIYGYHDSAKPFIKLYLIDPALVSTCSELLQSGAILNRAFQTYETHIPYLLQFCVDYNLYGMNLLYAGYFKFRVSNYIGFPSLLKKSEDLWSPSKFNSKYFLSSNSAPKCTSMELEVDISAWDILNRRDLQDNLSLNPGLEAMWTEEEMRRASRTNQSEKLPDLPTADELLPVEQDIGVDLSGSEIHYLSQWVDLLHQYAAPQMQQDNDVTFTESSTPNDDYISKWLECSHTDDEDADEEIANYKGDHTIEVTDDRIPVLQLTQEPIVLKTFIDNNTTTNSITSSSSSSIPQPTRSKSVSSFTTISSTGLQELYRLASATEEFDAWVPSTEQLDQLHNHLDNVSKMHCSLDATTLRHSQLLTNDADWTNSSPINTVEKEILNHGFNNNSIASQISILQPSQTTKKSIEQDGHEGHNDDDDEDEATLITNATQYALSFVCNQLSITNELTVGGNLLATVNKTIEDDEYMSQPAGGDLNEHIAKLSVDQNTNESSVSYDWDEISDDLFNSIDYLTSQELKSISEISGEDDEEDDDNVFHQHSTPVQIEKIKAEKILPTKDECSFSDSFILLTSSPPPPTPPPFDAYMISESGQHLSRGNSSQFNSQPVEIDSISDILFDSWSSGSDSSKSSCHRIPQVDGNMDASGTTDDYGENHNDNHSQTNLSSMIDGVNPVRKRRRLRLRLPHRQHTISRTIDGTQNRTIPGISSPISLSVPTSNHAYPSTNLCPDNISSPVIERKQDFTDKTFVEDSYTTVHSTPLARLDSKLKSRISTTLDDRYSNPVVILQRLPSSVLSSFSPIEPFCYQSGRLTPPEEFEDLSDTIVITSPQIDTSELNQSSSVNLFEQPIFSSFHHEISDFTCCCSPNTSDNIHPGRLSLYSQTQLSSPIGCNTDKHRVDQSHNGLPSTSLIASPPSIPFWRPIHSPPRLQVVNEWLQKLKASKDCKALNIFDTELNCIESQLDLSQTDEESPLHSNELFPQDTSDKMLNTSFQHSTAVHVPKSTEQNPVDVCSMNSSTGNEHLSTTGLSGVSSSVSVLYQAANERCYSSIQVDHTTVASLELHCRSRLTGSSGVIPTSTDFGVLAKSMKSSTTHSRCGLIPDPILDPIQVACLSFSHPRQVSSITQTIEQQSRCTDLFILILQSDLPGASTIPLKQLQCKYFHGLTNFGYEKRRKHKSRHLTPRMIWCTTEWSLISWIVYLIHTFDPEILIGYDVERFSWGYLVERANHLGRRTFTRELSRLAADIINCPHCHECVDECIKMVHTTTGITSGQKSQWHFDTQEFMNNLDQPCNCPCNPLYTSTLASKHFNYPTNNNTKDSNNPRVVWPCGPGAGRTGGLFACPGRVVLCFWRILMHEISLYEYSLETVVHELLKEYMPRYTFGQLNEWYMNVDGINRWRTVDYWIRRSVVNLRLLNTLDLIGRTSEFARVFGIEFYHVLSRGSQYRVESLLCRIAKQSNFLLPSPSVTQRAYQRAPEGIPLNLEPESVLFIDGPVVVLDFQSLYPSIIIAYNYCYSTVLGRLSCLLQGENAVFNLGCLSHSLPSGLLKKIGQEVNISPNGVVFVKKSIREGILPRMLRQLIATRLMVKDSIKLYKSDKCLNRLLDTRQLGLKLMANVTFGYTAASFSGRMPCVDLGDSIVHKARETLENAIRLVNSGEIILPDSCSGLSTPRVVYGDTDSLFIHLKGYGKLEAFDAAYRIAEVITSNNPVPIKLKFEKIYYPCILEAKKRYAGYAYESLDQVIPVFDAKGIETVRRDSCPFVGRILEECFKYLFNHFTIPQCVNNNDVTTSSCHKATGYENLDQTLKLAEYNMRNKIQQFAYRLVHGRIPFHECIIARPYWGQSAYKPGTFAPALQVARRLLSLDPRSEPLRGERVVYYVTSGRSDQTLLSCVRSIHEIYPSIWIAGKSATSRRVLAPRLNFAYYLDKQFIPPIERMTQVIGWRVRTWLSDLPRFLTSKHHRYNLTIGPSYAPPSTSQRRFTNLGSPSSSLSLSPSSSLLNLASGIQRKRYRRASSLMRAFVGQPPLICPSCEFIVPKTSSTDQLGHCRTCINGNSRLMNIGVIKLGCAINCIQSHLNRLETVCTYCTIHHDMKCDPIWLCNNLNCPISSQRLLGSADLALLWTHYTKCLNHQMDTVSSW